MVKLELKTIEEINVWNTMKRTLSDHSSYYVKNTYHPHHMEQWADEHAAIERTYLATIQQMQDGRIALEYEAFLCAREAEITAAANTLNSMKRAKSQRCHNAMMNKRNTSETSSSSYVRRSERIALMTNE
jgi:hypothetical protein